MKLGILICGKPNNEIIEELGDYRKIYNDFLSSKNNNFMYEYYLCYENEFPNEYDIIHKKYLKDNNLRKEHPTNEKMVQ